MNREELWSVAEIIGKLTERYRGQLAEHEAKMAEHRAAFGARTEADAKIIAGLRGERNWLRAEVAELKTQLERLKSHSRAPKYKVGDKLESYNRSLGLAIPVTVVGVRTVYDCQADGSEYPVGHSEVELNERYAQTPKHPVKVGEWVRRTTGSDTGRMAQVKSIAVLQYDVQIDGYKAFWASSNCEPCEPPEATHAEPDLTQLHAKGKEAWSDVPNATQWVEEMRGNTEATHDTEAGKAAAEAAATSVTEPVADEIKVGDLCEVFQATTRTLKTDIGITGRVSSVHLDPCHGGFLVKFDPSTQSRRSTGMQAFGLCDVRKVTT